MRKKENNCFTCLNCKKNVVALTNGSYRNHCPFCLYSRHMDDVPGDRKSEYLGLMKPTEFRYHTKKGYQLEHVCTVCSKRQWNKVAVDSEQNDHFLSWIMQK